MEELERIELLKQSNEEFEIIYPDNVDIGIPETQYVKNNVNLPHRQTHTKIKYTNTLV